MSNETKTPAQLFLEKFATATPRGHKADGTGAVKAFEIKQVELNPVQKTPVSLTGTVTTKNTQNADVVNNVRWNVQGGCYGINDSPAQNPLFDLVEKVSV